MSYRGGNIDGSSLNTNHYSGGGTGTGSTATATPTALRRGGQRYTQSEMDQRSALFGASVYGRQPPSAQSSKYQQSEGRNRSSADSRSKAPGDAGKYAAHSAAMMESANDDQILDLEAKVQDLKEISIQLREETQESNSMLGGMNVDFSRVGSMLGDTLRKLQVISSGASGRHIWLMVFFVMGLFFIMYLLYSRR